MTIKKTTTDTCEAWELKAGDLVRVAGVAIYVEVVNIVDAGPSGLQIVYTAPNGWLTTGPVIFKTGQVRRRTIKYTRDNNICHLAADPTMNL